MKNIIALETSTQSCSVAISKNEQVIATRFLVDRFAHSKELLSMIQSVLFEAGLSMSQIDAVACSVGPGTFTGVRIGVGATKGLAFGQDLPIIPVSSLMTTALTAVYESATPLSDLLVMNDARMNELYWARYHVKNEKLVAEPEQLSALNTLPLEDVATLVGTGLGEYKDNLTEHEMKFAKNALGHVIEYPKAECLIKGILEQRIDFTQTNAEDLRPNYLRNNIV